MSAPVIVAFVACVAGAEHIPDACAPWHRRIDRFGGYAYDVNPAPVTAEGCASWGWAYLAGPGATDASQPFMASKTTVLGDDWSGRHGLYAVFGMPNVVILPETIQCWPLDSVAQ